MNGVKESERQGLPTALCLNLSTNQRLLIVTREKGHESSFRIFMTKEKVTRGDGKDLSVAYDLKAAGVLLRIANIECDEA